MDVYLLNSPLAAAGYQRWRAPQPLYIHGPTQNERRFVTGGGLIRDESNLYMLIGEDNSLFGWSACKSSSSGGHSRCVGISKTVAFYQHSQLEMMGIMGTLVHMSKDHGYGLIRVDPSMYQGEEEAVANEAIMAEDLGAYIDAPEVMDFVEFMTASGEEVTGVVSKEKNYCVETRGGSRKRFQGLVVNTSSYPVAPEDCGIWVRRTIASDRPMLLGHIVGFGEGGDHGMLMLPFERLRSDLQRVIKRRQFNLL